MERTHCCGRRLVGVVCDDLSVEGLWSVDAVVEDARALARGTDYNSPSSASSQPVGRTLTFVHLSDLHFRESGSHLAAREAEQRDLLLEDIPKAVALAGGSVDAVLLTGDIARSGKVEEYQLARAWLDELCERLNIDSTMTLTVPGNHDIDWAALDFARKTVNASLRTVQEHLLDAKIDEFLSDPDQVLAPLSNYQEFAAAYSCDIAKALAWDARSVLVFGDGYSLDARGVNTVINSDEHDGTGTMAVQSNQIIAGPGEPGIVRMLMAHHGPDFWRRPKPTPGDCGHHVVLYGHTHTAEHRLVTSSCLEITAGAVHPEEKEQFSVPGYNVLAISIEEPVDDTLEIAHVRVRVFHRVFSREDHAFVDHDQAPTLDARIEIIRARTAPRPTSASTGHGAPMSSPAGLPAYEMPEVEMQPPLASPDGAPDPSRVVRARFERLGSGDRLRLLDRLGIPRELVVHLAPHLQIRELARIVIDEDRYEDFNTVLDGLDT